MARTSAELARKFHETYERLAPQFGYETRKETKQFDPDSPNGRLMIAVMEELFVFDPKPVSEMSDVELRALLDKCSSVKSRRVGNKNIVYIKRQ